MGFLDAFGELVFTLTIPMILVAADVSPLHLIQNKVRADSRRLLRFRGMIPGSVGVSQASCDFRLPTGGRDAGPTISPVRFSPIELTA